MNRHLLLLLACASLWGLFGCSSTTKTDDYFASTGGMPGTGGAASGGFATGGFAGTGGTPPLVCGAGQAACNAVCVDILSNTANCGACGVACPVGQLCQNAVCGCLAGQLPCAGGCFDPMTSAANCGACGVACPTGETCTAGVCTCQAGTTDCGGACVNTQTESLHCGGCNNACPATAPYCSVGVCSASCQAGLTSCGTSCVNILDDEVNCGGCGLGCPGGQTCTNGFCGCGAGQLDCGTGCVDVTANPSHCGSCGNACGGGQSCVGSACACPAGTVLCGGTCVVGTSCPCNPACGAGQSCVDGTCQTVTCAPACTGGKTCDATATCVCPAGQTDCGGTCTDLATNAANCGGCGVACSGGKVCAGGCVCPAGQEDCNGTCVATGSCATGCNPACTVGFNCVNGTCSCPAGQNDCSGTCADLSSSPTNCGVCGITCAAGRSCVSGTCSCPAGQTDCAGTCVNLSTDAANCGVCGTTCSGGQVCTGSACACPAGQILCSGTCVAGTTCNTTCTTGLGVISNFEEGGTVTPPKVLAQDGRNGEWERFFETNTTNFALAVQSSGNTDSCDQWALHATGSAAAGWGGWVGIGLNLTGTILNPAAYNASKYVGIRFKARRGTGHDPKSAVRFNVSIPETEGTGSPGDNDACSDIAATTDKAARPCYQHMGRFLHVASGYEPDQELTTSWKTFNYCFDRDLYPLSLPSNLSNAQRAALASRILKLQFQFNQGKDWYVSSYPTEGQYTALAKNLPFDFWINDLEFIEGACPNSTTFTSTSGTADPFPQNANIGTCSPGANASVYANAISQAYARWTARFVVTDGGGARVIAPEQENGVTTSESMGYGMLIAAAMGDKTNFDRFWTYVQAHMANGLMIWKPNGGSGSATDGDVDIAYALLMANAQWGGYSAAATSMITAIKSRDVNTTNNRLKPGDGWEPGFNPSYFAPSYFRAFGGMDAVITTNYGFLTTNVNAGTGRFPTDWTDWSGNAVTGQSIGAQVTAGFTVPVFGYDAARVPWRIGLDGCGAGGAGSTLSTAMVSYFAQRYDAGATIDLMKAGWIKTSGNPAAASDGAVAKDFQGSFIGPIGVGAMAANNAAVRDRAMRTILDILENGDFNHTYFPSTVGFITLLIMSGNFPTP